MTLILFRANRDDALQLQSILDVYEEFSGQIINRDKSAIKFSPNTSSQKKKRGDGGVGHTK